MLSVEEDRNAEQDTREVYQTSAQEGSRKDEGRKKD